MRIKDVSHHDIFRHGEHCINQIATRLLRNGELVAVYNEERFPYHHDSGQTVMLRSATAAHLDRRTVVLPYTDTTGNWDCGICELADGTLLVNLTIAGYFKRGIRPEQPSWTRGRAPRSAATGRGASRRWAGSARTCCKSTDGGETWSEPIPVNVRPLKHGGCRLGCWLMPSGSLLLGVYGRIRGYGEEGENESTRSALLRSDDGGFNWEYYSTMAFDAASIIDYEEPAMVRLADGRIVGMHAHARQPERRRQEHGDRRVGGRRLLVDAAEIHQHLGLPGRVIALPDGRNLMIYGYRRPPYGVRGWCRKTASPGTSRTSSSSARAACPARPRRPSSP